MSASAKPIPSQDHTPNILGLSICMKSMAGHFGEIVGPTGSVDVVFKHTGFAVDVTVSESIGQGTAERLGKVFDAPLTELVSMDEPKDEREKVALKAALEEFSSVRDLLKFMCTFALVNNNPDALHSAMPSSPITGYLSIQMAPNGMMMAFQASAPLGGDAEEEDESAVQTMH